MWIPSQFFVFSWHFRFAESVQGDILCIRRFHHVEFQLNTSSNCNDSLITWVCPKVETSGKLTQLGKITMFHRQIKDFNWAIFNFYVSQYQRVHPIKSP